MEEGTQQNLLLNELNFKNDQKICEHCDKFIDISQLNLQFFPLSTYKTCRNIQHIYLEGNKVEKLDDNFFLVFQQLQWLDIRNNELLQIPKSIAKHPCLQVLLLEGNKLKELPVELGSVPNLRGLQLLRNPLSYPPKNVLEKGSTAVIQFLQKEWKKYEVCSENNKFNTLKSLQRISSTGTLPSINENNKEKLKCSKANNSQALTRKKESYNLKDCVTIIKLVRPKLKTTMTICKNFIIEADENNQKFPLIEIIKQASENAKVTSLSTIDGDEKVSSRKEIKLGNSSGLMVKSKLIKDIWLKKIRTVLEEQQSELQRRRSKDALEKWQHDAKDLQIKKWMDYLKGEASQLPQLEMPYAVDEEYKRMISRSEIGKEKSSNSKRRVSKSTENNSEMVTSKISAILDVLQELRKTRSVRVATPRSEKRDLSFEIKKINELQRTVTSLKGKNINLL